MPNEILNILNRVEENASMEKNQERTNDNISLEYKTTLNNLVQLQSNAVISNLLTKEVDATTSEPMIQIPLSYIIQSKSLIKCLNSIVDQAESTSPLGVQTKIDMQQKTKKRKAGKAAIITDDAYKDNLVAASAKKFKKEKREDIGGKKQNKPIIKSISTLSPDNKINNDFSQTNLTRSVNHNDIFNFEPKFLSPHAKLNFKQQQKFAVIADTATPLQSVTPYVQYETQSQPAVLNSTPDQIIDYSNIDVSSIPILFA